MKERSPSPISAINRDWSSRENEIRESIGPKVVNSFVVEGNDCMHLSDFQEVLGPDAHELAEGCFEMLDPDGNGDMNLDEATLKMTDISWERKAITKSMHDVS